MNNNRPRRNQFSSNEAFQNAMRKYKGKGPATANSPPNLTIGKILNGLNGRELARMRAVSKAYRNYIDSRPNLVNKIRNAEHNNITIKLIRAHNQALQRALKLRNELRNRGGENLENKFNQAKIVVYNAQTALVHHFFKLRGWGLFSFDLKPVRLWNYYGKGGLIGNFARRHGL